MLCQVRLGQVRLGQVRLGQARLGQARLGQARLGQVRLGQFRLGKVRLAQVRFGQVRLVILYFNKILRRVGFLSQLQLTHQNCSFQFNNYNHRLISYQNFCLFLGWKILLEFANTIIRSYYYNNGSNGHKHKIYFGQIQKQISEI